MLSRWKPEFIDNAAKIFSKETDELEKVKKTYKKEKVYTAHLEYGYRRITAIFKRAYFEFLSTVKELAVTCVRWAYTDFALDQILGRDCIANTSIHIY
jgi:hypothetical protein